MTPRSRIVSVVAAGFLLSIRAEGDIGPSPVCPSGQHGQYLMGHHCVADGFTLVESDQPPGYVTVANPAKPKPAGPETPPAPPPAKTSGCATAPVEPVGAMLVGIGFAVRGRRRRARVQ